MSAVLLDRPTADRLAKLCGMFGSEHEGERASAAALADRLVRAHGLTWWQLLRPRPDSIEQMIDFALDHGDLDAWQTGFLLGIRGRQFLTEKQLAKLDGIYAAVCRRAAA